MDHTIVEVYADNGISGSKGRNGRPAFDRSHRDAARRKFDIVMAWSVDRLSRSLQDLVAFLSELHALGIELYLHQQGLDTTTPAGKAMFQMLGVFAEFERAIIREPALPMASPVPRRLRRPGAVPKQTYIGGSMTLEVGGRRAELTHVTNAHTDGDTWIYFADANVLCTGDTMNNTKRYQTIDFANGGDIRGMIRATDTYLRVANDDTKVMTGHGALAKKADIAEFNAMLKTARERVEKLFNEGKSEAGVIAARPLKDLDAKWAASDEAAVAFTKMVYNSFKRS